MEACVQFLTAGAASGGPMTRSLLFALIWVGVAQPALAACPTATIGHVVDAKGDWFDTRYQHRVDKNRRVRGQHARATHTTARQRSPGDSAARNGIEDHRR